MAFYTRRSEISFSGWQGPYPPEEEKSSVEFLIEYRIFDKVRLVRLFEEQIKEKQNETIIKSFLVEARTLLSNLTSHSCILNMILQVLNLPHQRIDGGSLRSLTNFIYSLAIDIEEFATCTGHMTLPMVVEVEVLTIIPCYDADEDGEDEWVPVDFDDNKKEWIPATRSSIEALEKVIFEGMDFTVECSICLDELLIGSEVTRIPCSHLFHGDCIVSWLNKNNVCPLCRFQMPS